MSDEKRTASIGNNGILVYFAAWKEHIGFYPTASGIRAFERELSAYECYNGDVRFPIEVAQYKNWSKKVCRRKNPCTLA